CVLRRRRPLGRRFGWLLPVLRRGRHAPGGHDLTFVGTLLLPRELLGRHAPVLRLAAMRTALAFPDFIGAPANSFVISFGEHRSTSICSSHDPETPANRSRSSAASRSRGFG